MVNSKGGFLVEDDKEVNDVQKAKERERERQRAMQSLEPRVWSYLACRMIRLIELPRFRIAVFLEKGKNPQCVECGSIDLDQTYRKVFRCLVCNKCKNEKPEKYSLLTKTECKEVTRYPYPV